MFESVFEVLFNPIKFFKKKCTKPSLGDSLFSLGLSTATMVAGSMPVFRYILLPLNKFEVSLFVTVMFLIYVFLSVGLYLVALKLPDKSGFARKLLFTFVPFMFLPIPLVFLSLPGMMFKLVGIMLLIVVFVWTFFLERLTLFLNDPPRKEKWKHLLMKVFKDGVIITLLIISIANN